MRTNVRRFTGLANAFLEEVREPLLHGRGLPPTISGVRQTLRATPRWKLARAIKPGYARISQPSPKTKSDERSLFAFPTQ